MERLFAYVRTVHVYPYRPCRIAVIARLAGECFFPCLIPVARGVQPLIAYQRRVRGQRHALYFQILPAVVIVLCSFPFEIDDPVPAQVETLVLMAFRSDDARQSADTVASFRTALRTSLRLDRIQILEYTRLVHRYRIRTDAASVLHVPNRMSFVPYPRFRNVDTRRVLIFYARVQVRVIHVRGMNVQYQSAVVPTVLLRNGTVTYRDLLLMILRHIRIQLIRSEVPAIVCLLDFLAPFSAI